MASADKRGQQNLASERMLRLLQLAEKEAVEGEFELARNHVRLARAVGMRHNVGMPKGFAGRYCRKCSSFFVSSNSRTRLNSSEKKIEVKCVDCGRVVKKSYGN